MALWVKILLGVLGVAGVVLGVLVWVGAMRGRLERTRLIARLRLPAGGGPPQPVDFARLEKLPAPVARYLRRSLVDGQPRIEVAHLRQSGRLRVKIGGARWSRFEAEQLTAPRGPGFLWEARVRMGPLFHVEVRDSFVEGQGAAQVSLLSCLRLAREQGLPALSEGALHRFLAEAVWYPTALLPSAQLRWQAGETADRAVATLSAGGLAVSLEYRFNDAGEVTSVYTPARQGRFERGYEARPWRGRFFDYHTRSGMRVPARGDVSWQLGETDEAAESRWWVFWEGTVVDARYELAARPRHSAGRPSR